MPYRSPVVAHVTRLGYVLCPPCGANRDDLIDDYVADNWAVADQRCDGCHASIVYDPTLRVHTDS